ncbi:hypothetical protein [Marinibactrum halimedae]|uniref:Lambda-like tail fibre protein N-terminal domain-containing protein n=1 Tax=Marinibactrum halimedae TaxID=1444977 RepID=A0AA37TEW2_9GAMM|nr:hypothetical protein [Marinibactrum halimedae]MCD9458883.1 hypothetical protein [Marinibactrum halimedae]GLS27732.1 hypothetical protein GCM10007877_34510 [Marinibactrum halimedae]
MITLKGQLQDPINGGGLANALITLTAKRNEAVAIVKSASATFETDAAGNYEQSVLPGFYNVRISVVNVARELGSIVINPEDRGEITLNSLLSENDTPLGTVETELRAILQEVREKTATTLESAQIAVDAKDESVAAADAAKTSENNAKASEGAAANSAQSALNDANRADEAATQAVTASNATGENLIEVSRLADQVANDANTSTQMREDLEAAVESASNSATSAENSATLASESAQQSNNNLSTVQALEAGAQEALTGAQESERISTENASTTELNKNNAAQSATDAQAALAEITTISQTVSSDAADSAASASDAKADADRAEVAATRADDIAKSIANALVFMGAWDASSNTEPPIPEGEPNEPAHFYKVSVAGQINDVNYAVGDNIVWDTQANQWFKIDNSDAVFRVNGKQGDVIITALDVGALPSGGTAQNSELWDGHRFGDILNQDVRTTARPTFNGATFNQNITLSGSASHIIGRFGNMVTSRDGWLRLNDGGGHEQGTYCNGPKFRADARIEMGSSGTHFLVTPSICKHAGNDLAYTSERENDGTIRYWINKRERQFIVTGRSAVRTTGGRGTQLVGFPSKLPSINYTLTLSSEAANGNKPGADLRFYWDEGDDRAQRFRVIMTAQSESNALHSFHWQIIGFF